MSSGAGAQRSSAGSCRTGRRRQVACSPGPTTGRPPPLPRPALTRAAPSLRPGARGDGRRGPSAVVVVACSPGPTTGRPPGCCGDLGARGQGASSPGGLYPSRPHQHLVVEAERVLPCCTPSGPALPVVRQHRDGGGSLLLLTLITYYSLLITYYLLLITSYLLLITYYILLITYHVLLMTYDL